MKFDQARVEKEFERDLLLQDSKIMHPIIASRVTNPKYLRLASLDQILSTTHAKNEVFKTRFSTMMVSDVSKIVKVQNKKTDALRESTAGALKKDE